MSVTVAAEADNFGVVVVVVSAASVTLPMFNNYITAKDNQ